MLHLLNLSVSGQQLQLVCRVTDNKPVLYSELVQWLVNELTVELKVDLGEELAIEISAIAGKRCSNQRLLDSGYQFTYPGYKEGLRNLVIG